MAKKILFLGGGNMAEGIIGGLIMNKVFEPENIMVSDVIDARLAYLEQTYSIKTTKDTLKEAETADIIFLAVRPQNAEEACRPLKAVLESRKDVLVISIISSTDLAKLADFVGDKKIVRVMPNTLIKAQEGYSAACINKNIEEEDKKDISAVLDAIGQTMYIDESMFDTFTAYGCAGPLFVYYLIHAMIEAGVYNGFSRKESYDMTIKNVIGAGKMMEATGKHPLQIVDTMTSPGGVGIEELQSLEESGFQGIVMKAMKEGVEKATRMGK